MSDWLQQTEKGLIVTVRVVPRASKDEIAGPIGNEALKVRIQAPPLEGRANTYLIKYLARLWNIPRSNLEILSGEKGRNKRLLISGPSDAVFAQLAALENK